MDVLVFGFSVFLNIFPGEIKLARNTFETESPSRISCTGIFTAHGSDIVKQGMELFVYNYNYSVHILVDMKYYTSTH